MISLAHVGGEVFSAPAVAKLEEAFLLSTASAASVNGFNPLYCNSNMASVLVDERDVLEIDFSATGYTRCVCTMEHTCGCVCTTELTCCVISCFNELAWLTLPCSGL